MRCLTYLSVMLSPLHAMLYTDHFDRGPGALRDVDEFERLLSRWRLVTWGHAHHRLTDARPQDDPGHPRFCPPQQQLIVPSPKTTSSVAASSV